MNKVFKNLKMGNKIHLSGLAVLFLFILSVLALNLIQNKMITNDHFFENHKNFSSLMAAQSSLFFITQDTSDLKATNRIKKSFPSIVGYHLIDQQMEGFTLIDDNTKWPLDINMMVKNFYNSTDGIIYENQNYLVYKYSVELDHNIDSDFDVDSFTDKKLESLGNAFILVSTKIETVDQVRYFSILFLFGLFFVITWFFYSIFLKKNFIKPVTDLSKSMETASKGIFIPAKSDQNSLEFINMAQHFNNLLSQTKEKEFKLNQAIKDAENKVVEKTEFSATLSHEIRTPLNGVIGALDLIDTNKMDESNSELLATVKQSASHLLNITNSSLDFSKYSMDDVEFHQSTVNLHDLLISCMNIHKSNAMKKDLLMQVHYDSNIPLHFEIDETKFQQMVSNLIGNAIKFTKKGFITIEVKLIDYSLNSCELEIIIQDSGIGIASDKLETIFEPYKQENGSSTRLVGGTGLGLSISKRLANLMGGTLHAESILDEGSSFVVSLEMTTSESKYKAQTFFKKTSQLLHDNYNYTAFIQNELFDICTRKLFDNFNIKYCNDIHGLQEHLEDSNNILITDYDTNKLRYILKDKDVKIIQLNKLFESKESLFIDFPQNKAKLNAKMLDFVNPHNYGVDKNIEKNKIESIEQRDDLKIDGELSILVAEDNPVNQMIIQRVLNKCNQSNVIIADNGEIALKKFSSQHFDLVFMDCNMPIKDGYETTLDIRSLEEKMNIPNVPIIALTASMESSDMIKCKNVGMNQFISKPFDQQKIEQALSYIKNREDKDFVIR